MKNSKVLKEIFLNFILTLFISLFSFLINRYFAFYLGVQNLGLMKLFTQLLAYLNLAEIGLASASTYALYKPLAEKNYKQISIVINTITSLYNKIFLFSHKKSPLFPFMDLMGICTFYFTYFFIVFLYTFVKASLGSSQNFINSSNVKF